MPAPVEEEATEEEKQMEEERKKMPRADAMLLIDDFEYWAEKVLSGTAWNYYKSAADREISECLLTIKSPSSHVVTIQGVELTSSRWGKHGCIQTILFPT